MDQSKFDKAFKLILELEGGSKITRDEKDLGGTTRFGISQRAHPEVDIENLTEAQAKAIYKKEYWDQWRCEELTYAFAVALFDGLVNQGPVCIKLLQYAVGAKADGLMGKATIAAVNSQPDIEYGLEEFMAMRALRYAATKNFSRFGKGWFRRLFRVHHEALNA